MGVVGRDPGSGAFLTPGLGIRDPGWVESQHPDPGGKFNVCVQGEVLVHNVIHYVPLLLSNHRL